jgi:hypothetical protein
MPGKSVGVSGNCLRGRVFRFYFLAHIAPRIFLLLCSKTHEMTNVVRGRVTFKNTTKQRDASLQEWLRRDG